VGGEEIVNLNDCFYDNYLPGAQRFDIIKYSPYSV
jgi:hypothetical protein